MTEYITNENRGQNQCKKESNGPENKNYVRIQNSTTRKLWEKEFAEGGLRSLLAGAVAKVHVGPENLRSFGSTKERRGAVREE